MAAGLAMGAGLAVGKALPFISKHLLSLLISGGIIGSQALGEVGRGGERKLARGQMELETLLAKSSMEAGKKATTESRARAKEYTEQLLTAKREERRESRDIAAMESFTQSQDRQMALILQAIQTMSARPMGAGTQAPGGGGMLGLMRGA